MKKKYTINWVERVGYYTEVEASSEKEAKEIFWDGGHTGLEPDGYAEIEEETIYIIEKINAQN